MNEVINILRVVTPEPSENSFHYSPVAVAVTIAAAVAVSMLLDYLKKKKAQKTELEKPDSNEQTDDSDNEGDHSNDE